MDTEEDLYTADKTAGVSENTPERPAESTTPTASSSTAAELSDLGEFNVYLPPSRPMLSSTSEEVPVDFFTPTADELRAIQATLSTRARALREAPLLTEKLRNEKESQRRQQWPKATIRVKFANRTMLEKVFQSSDKIKAVYAFVRSCLREDVRPHKFVLYDTPPRRELRVSDPTVRDKTLYDLQLAPQSVLMFQFLEEDFNLDISSSPPPLLPAILSRAISLDPRPSPQDESVSTAPERSKPLATIPSELSARSSTDKKLPKWLKLGKK